MDSGIIRRYINDFKLSKWMKERIPILDWLPKYDTKIDGPCDLIAGITVGIMHIPQGLGYALMANVPPVVGMYMAFFPQLAYTPLGTSRHNSMGTFAVITLLVGKSVVVYAMNEDYQHDVTREINGTMITQREMYTELEVGTTVTFFSGLWQMLLFALNLGAVSNLLSDAFVSSFIAGAGIHIFTSQIKEIVGVKIHHYIGPYNLPKVWRDLFKEVWNASPEQWTTIGIALGISAVCFGLLILTVIVIRPWLLKYTRVPFPAELILVVSGVFVATGLDLKEKYGTIDIGTIPTGLPAPQLPFYELGKVLMLDSFVTAFVSYSITMSMGIILAQGRNYVIDPNQELLALGVGNLFSCHFSCIAYGSSLSRSMVLNDVGGATQLTGLTAAGLMVIVLLYIADFFEPLPRAVLACIITVALREIFEQVADFPGFWRRKKLDGIIWIAVFLIVVIVDVDIGLGIGFILSAAMIFREGIKGTMCVLGNVPNTDIYLDIDNYKKACEVEGFKIISYRGGLVFATRDNFKKDLIKYSELDPIREAKRLRKLAKRQAVCF
ncbi:prestin-like [Cloeon dipterum]|uniref:prestin-like n=1 Tax=Cloeon dipterum TaxID=197152 RepID=UPI00321FC9D6